MTEMRESVTVHSRCRSILGLALRITLLHSWMAPPPTSQHLSGDWEELKAGEKGPQLQCRHQQRKGARPLGHLSVYFLGPQAPIQPSASSWLLSLFCEKSPSLTLPIPPFASVALSLFVFYPIHSLRQTATSTTISNIVIYNITRPVFLKRNKQTESHTMARTPQTRYGLDTLINCKWATAFHLQRGGCLEFQSQSA